MKANTFFYAITGTILTYYFANPQEPLIKYALLLPLVLSLILGLVFTYGARLSDLTRMDVADLSIELGLRTAPEYMLLTTVARVCALMFFGVAVAIVVVLIVR